MTDGTREPRRLRLPAGARELREQSLPADVPVSAVGRTGLSAIDPLVTATVDGETAFYPSCSAAQLDAIAESLADGTLDRERSVAVVEHDPSTDSLPRPPLDALQIGVSRLLGGAGWRRPTDPDDHATAGGFVDATPGEICDVAGELLGRGWGDWDHDEPVAEGWQRASEAGAETAVVVNAHGTPADVLLAESVPFDVLDGATLAARATGADRIVVYCSEDDRTAIDRVREAADAYPDAVAPFEVVAGPAAYRAAEPTMALEAIEGNHRLEARLRPSNRSLPTLDGKPAHVHTARTYAQLAVALRTGESPSTRLVTVSGDVEDPATVELPEGQTLATALDAVRVDGEFKAACVGGRFGGLTASLDVTVAPDALLAADLGTEGTIEVLAADRCVLSFVGQRAQFATDTNCGRCVPCREGTKQLTERLRDVYDGDVDRHGIEELVRTMTGSSVCEFGVAAGRPVRTALQSFEAEVRAHADGHCPTDSCTDHVEATS